MNMKEYLFPSTEHTFRMFVTQITPGTIFFILLCLMSAFYVLSWIIKQVRMIVDPYYEIKLAKERNVTQDLQSFYKSLRKKQLRGFLKEEKICREKLHFNRLTEEAYISLAQENEERNLLKGLGGGAKSGNMQDGHNYNFLSLQSYCYKYMYIPHTFKSRSEYIVSMYKNAELQKVSVELIRYVADLAYVPMERAKSLVFNPEALYKDQQNSSLISNGFDPESKKIN